MVVAVTRFDWRALENDLADALVRAVSALVADRHDERFYAAALWLLYRETDGPIRLPMLAVNTEQALGRLPADERDDLRWSPADWEYDDVDWLSGDVARRWEHDLAAHARRGTVAQWDATFDRFVTALVTVCRRARRGLGGLPVVVLDAELHATVVPRILTKAETRRMFPELDEQTRARSELAALPPDRQAAHLVGLLGTFDGPIGSEDAETALRDLGPAAVPALLPRLTVDGEGWQAAKILADIGLADDTVVQALAAALHRTNGADRSWVASALSRLGRLDIVLAAPGPPGDVATAVTAPYRSFRDHASAPRPLDYAPLERAIEDRPDLLAMLESELSPGTPMCQIGAAEVDEALRGTGSPHPLVRRHAVTVLGERRLGAAAGRRVLPVLARRAADDPDPVVRRLSVLGLRWWGRQGQAYLDVGRTACGDPDGSVRVAAQGWLDEAGG
ncbi:hypothetical protein Vau01_112830 [Virgisporangium aurantiacum]|uniref:HEAT repeat-containing protein n=1 Tax=Virgisporangium aurantiacum TaxID=175570 RepID=A0A8J3ZGM3_9ACTN|nr:hypothetical protein Vau01_112830 [Virgisporangium aurantiacum]